MVHSPSFLVVLQQTPATSYCVVYCMYPVLLVSVYVGFPFGSIHCSQSQEVCHSVHTWQLVQFGKVQSTPPCVSPSAACCHVGVGVCGGWCLWCNKSYCCNGSSVWYLVLSGVVSTCMCVPCVISCIVPIASPFCGALGTTSNIS